MGKLPLQNKVCTFIFWALMLRFDNAEREYFQQSRKLTWDDARIHCQECFENLVTLTPENIQTIVQNHTSHYWVGLRKNSSSSSRMLWSQWANGDPLTFQNWYPGWPVFKSTFPKRDCCSCSCTCPARTSSTTPTGFTTPNAASFTGMENMTSSNGWESTQPPLEAACVRSPMLDIPDPDENYIEDSCVAMLSFGAWVEKNCSELLPFICYEDRFFGKATMTNVTSVSAILTWLPGPGNISHYRVEVKGDKELTANRIDLTYELVSLTAGTRYSVHVFPVKCMRDLNPQEVAFYTIPNKVERLEISKVTETSISLRWSKPAGNVDFYLIEVQGRQIRSDTEGVQVGDLTPGNLYTFTIISGVKDNSTWSKETSITEYTRPGKVSDLRVSENTNNSLLLNWVPPTGNTTGFRVTAVNNNNDTLFAKVVNETKVRVENLPMGSKITLSVTALANDTVEGDTVTVINYTAPGPVSNLTLVTTHSTLTATWTSPLANSSFTVKLQLDGKNVQTVHELSEPRKDFENLKTAAHYTVIVSVVIGQLEGPPVECSKFTLPSPPTDATASSCNEEQIMFQWKAPLNTARVNYYVKISSSFWGYSWSGIVDNETSHIFTGLKSGTRYEFEVQTMAGEMYSTPAYASNSTVAVKREISLSMLCSSAESLLCAKNTTRQSVFYQLRAHFNKLLGDNIFWNLEEQETEN